MKKNTKIISLIGLTCLTAFGATAASIAWFSQTTNLAPQSFSGKTDGAFFAYGKGTVGSPYGLNAPRHLYNLAWLNMMGYFKDKDVYFEIDPKIDGGVLDGTDDNGNPTVIPPIGTEKYPFTGSFNGNGKIISNFVISANKDDYQKKPYNADEIFAVPQIVGLFGVIGYIPNASSSYTFSGAADQLYNLGITNLEIRTYTQNSLVGIVAGYVNGKISNVAVNTSAINVSTNTTAAVDATNFTPNLSDYGIIGHCTQNYSDLTAPVEEGTYYDKKDISKHKATIYGVKTVQIDEFNAHEKGETAGSGASLDMKKMYTNLHDNWTKFINDGATYKAKYLTGSRETITKKDGTIVVDETNLVYQNTYNNFSTDDQSSYNSQGNNRHSYYNYTQSDGTNQTASYAYIIEPNNPYQISTNTGLAEEAYMCLVGSGANEEIPVPSVTYNDIDTHYNLSDGYYFRYTSGTTNNYLTRGATGFNVTNSNNASLWYFNSSDHTILTADANNDDTRYFLNCSNQGVLSITTTSSTAWYYDSSKTAYYAQVSGTNYYLGFNGTAWATTTYNNTTFYYIRSGNNYLTHNGARNVNPLNTNTSSTTPPAGANTHWFLDSNNRFRTTDGGSYYLAYRNNIRAYNSSSYAMTYSGTTNNGDNTGTISRSGTYLTYNNGWTSATTSRDVTVTKVGPSYTTDIHSGDVVYESAGKTFYNKESITTAIRSKIKLNETYYPLKGDISGDNLAVNDANTGYVISGSNYKTTSDPYGDIRVSAFNISDLSNSYTANSSTFNHVYTYDGSDREVVLSGDDVGRVGNTSKYFSRFVNSSAQMLNTLSQDNTAGKIYGLHFMDATISTSNTIKAPWVKVADKDPKNLAEGENPFSTYTNFEMPEDSIDFHFKENGIINFFAGTYYTGNNAFFSLHQIERYKAGDTIPQGKSVNDIKSIKEIEYIYENTQASTKAEYPYVYKFKGSSTYSTGTAGTQLFSTSWITNPTISHSDAAYYFEIPANKGEYALGAVGGKKGAYLMYLDLGANANKIARTQVSEHFTTIDEKYDYPLGVAFVPSITVNSSGLIDINPLDSVNVVVQPGYTGTVDIERSSATAATATISNSAQQAKVSAGYYKDTISFTDGTNPLKTLPKERITTEHKRVELLDYGITFLTMTRTVVEQAVITTEKWGVVQGTPTTSTTIKQYAYNADGSLNASKTYTTTQDESKIKVYNPDDPQFPGEPYDDPKTEIFALYDNTNTTPTYDICFTTESGTTVEFKFDLAYTAINNSYYYQVNGYNITIRVVGENVVVTITNGLTSYTFKINGTAANSGTVNVTAGAQITDP